MPSDTTTLENRVLVLAPTARDRDVTKVLLADNGMCCESHTDATSLARAIEQGAGAVLLTEDALGAPDIRIVVEVLSRQPNWSDLPLVVLMRGGPSSSVVRDSLNSLTNVVLLERPAPVRSVASALQAAVRSRQRQYQIRDQLEQIRHSNEQLANAAEEREHLLESERKARNVAEAASRAKDEFVATLSHELRTPMTAVLGWVQLLRRNPSDTQSVEHGLEVIERNAKLQARLIEDLLEMSRIISGKVRLNVRDVNVCEAIETAVDSVRHSMAAKNLSFSTDVEYDGTLCADPERLQQILWNLLSNAVKFTPSGGSMQLAVRRIGETVQVVVQDSGCGIAPDFLPHVFERFCQYETSTTRRAGGLGLGLGIVKHLVELHGGFVRAHSEGEGKGATFIVEIPIRAKVSEESEPAHRDGALYGSGRGCDLRGLRVLIIDDDPDVRELIHRMLAHNKADVVTASSAREGLLHVSKRKPDLLVCDIGMPEMDGYEFIREVRKEFPRSDGLPAAALTAYASEHDRLRALKAGYQAHLAKPVQVEELVEIVARLGGRRPRFQR